MLREPSSLLGKSIEVWCFGIGVPVAVEATVAHVVRENEHDVGVLGRMNGSQRGGQENPRYDNVLREDNAIECADKSDHIRLLIAVVHCRSDGASATYSESVLRITSVLHLLRTPASKRSGNYA